VVAGLAPFERADGRGCGLGLAQPFTARHPQHGIRRGIGRGARRGGPPPVLVFGEDPARVATRALDALELDADVADVEVDSQTVKGLVVNDGLLRCPQARLNDEVSAPTDLLQLVAHEDVLPVLGAVEAVKLPVVAVQTELAGRIQAGRVLRHHQLPSSCFAEHAFKRWRDNLACVVSLKLLPETRHLSLRFSEDNVGKITTQVDKGIVLKLKNLEHLALNSSVDLLKEVRYHPRPGLRGGTIEGGSEKHGTGEAVNNAHVVNVSVSLVRDGHGPGHDEAAHAVAEKHKRASYIDLSHLHQVLEQLAAAVMEVLLLRVTAVPFRIVVIQQDAGVGNLGANAFHPVRQPVEGRVLLRAEAQSQVSAQTQHGDNAASVNLDILDTQKTYNAHLLNCYLAS